MIDFADEAHGIGGAVDEVGFEAVDGFDGELEAALACLSGDGGEFTDGEVPFAAAFVWSELPGLTALGVHGAGDEGGADGLGEVHELGEVGVGMAADGWVVAGEVASRAEGAAEVGFELGFPEDGEEFVR